ncbi:MAG: lipid-binding SYLF domain-containing protein [Shimia sp.]
MTVTTRRGAIALLGAATLAGCGNGIGNPHGPRIDARADNTLNFMYTNYPETRSLREKSTGLLVMPVVTEAGLGLGGSYGQGVLRINESTVDYYSATSASAGLQIGAQQYAHVLFFMTEQALQDFRQGSGWAAGGDIEYALRDQAQGLRASTTTGTKPIVAAVFGTAGFRLGATLEGTKYTRIIP